MIKGSIQKEDLTLINVYVPNIGAHKYIFKNTNRHIEITDGNAMMVGHPTFINGQVFKIENQYGNRDPNCHNRIVRLNIYRKLHPKETGFTFFSSAHVTFSRIDDILGHKTSCNKFKRIVTILSIFSNYNGVKLKINHRKRNKKKLDCMKTSNKILKNQCQ